MPNNKTVLRTAYHSIEQEVERIRALLNPCEESPLGMYSFPISSKFGKAERAVRSCLENIDKAIQKDNFKLGWDQYVTLRARQMPVLSSELLAVIGGWYLRKAELDYVGRVGQMNPRHGTISFSRLAEDLVKDLADRSNLDMASVLIVGEERLAHSEAAIIRLRFPACDIWHLPFTAHEYGYLAAANGKVDLLKGLQDQVRTNVDPTKHTDATPPSDEKCFSTQVRALWNEYYAPETKDKGNFSINHREEISNLAEQQKTHLCRLFADAFASFFVGPAYVHALLQLGFMPETSLYQPSQDMPQPYVPPQQMPPFAHRFVFALEILKWMNDEPIVDPGTPEHPFEREVDPSSGIPDLWRQTIASIDAKQKDPYPDIASNYQEWLTKTKDILNGSFGFNFAIGKTYENWRTAKSLEPQLIEANLKVAAWPTMWSVLNAAWSARYRNENEWMLIEDNVLRLLRRDSECLKSMSKTQPAGADTSSFPDANATNKRDCIVKVRRALARDSKLLEQFNAMVDQNHFERKQEILEVLSEKDPKDPDYAYQAFQDLLANLYG